MRQGISGMLAGVVLLVVLIGGNALAGGRPSHWIARSTTSMLASVGSSVELIRSLGGEGQYIDDASLRARIAELEGVEIQRLELEREVAFLKAASDIRDRLPGTPVIGGIFAFSGAGGVREVLVNRGTDDGVFSGSLVVDGSGRFIGVVREVFARQSAVRILGDPGLEVAGRVLGTDISGLIRASSGQGLLLDLVRKDEAASEGQVVVTSGDDQFPAGIVIGTVRSVDTDATLLFKTVRITPSITVPPAGRVLITTTR